MPKKVRDEERLSVRLEFQVSAGLRKAIEDAARRTGAISDAEYIRQALARAVQKDGASIKRLPSPPTRPARGARRKQPD